ncbi:MAG: LPS export ABC transporter periplasmic protein LptC [Spirochaetales bacterium]|nr:LPS export ABC transporter periplasmic protein LptC [Spirochaetales bacterium]
MKKLFPPFILLLFSLTACQINYELAGGEDDESIPDIYMEGLRQIQTSGGETAFILTADSASLFSEEGETFFVNMEFEETDESGSVLRRGSVGKARSYNKNDADLTEGIKIESYRDDVMIEGETFYWKDGLQQLSAPADTLVTMVREGDTTISGTGFHADFRLNEIRFKNSVEGVIHIED